MKTTKKKQTTNFTRQQCHELIERCLRCDSLESVADELDRTADKLRRYRIDKTRGKRVANAWRVELKHLAESLRLNRPNYRIFTKGNSKLPFFSFSTLPKYTCPGAGACLEWCYSFRAWRYPAAFLRQLQNTLFLRFDPSLIRREFAAIPKHSIVRLYVDGDFDSARTIGFWFRLLTNRPDVKAYGYSKSWELLRDWSRQGLPIPNNYKLNLSSGSKHDDDDDLKNELTRAEFTRGEFVCVETTGTHKKGFARFDLPEYHADVRQSAREQFGTSRVFSCPGQCGDCLPNGEHACGSDQMKNVLIAIAEHN